MTIRQTLMTELLSLRPGEKLIVPYRLYSSNSIKVTVAKINANREYGRKYTTRSNGEISMTVTRLE